MRLFDEPHMLLRVSLLTAVAIFAASPRDSRAALDQGRPACDYCRMILTEPGFGGEIAVRSGPRKIYDSVECMAAAVLTDTVPQREIRAICASKTTRQMSS